MSIKRIDYRKELKINVYGNFSNVYTAGIITPKKKRFLIDTVIDSIKYRWLLDLEAETTSWRGKDYFSVLVITNPFAFHINGLYRLLNRHNLWPENFIRPKYLTEKELRAGSEYYQLDVSGLYSYLHLDAEYPFLEIKSYSEIADKREEGVDFSFFYPQNFLPFSGKGLELNHYTVVSVLSFFGEKALFLSDISNFSLEGLLQQQNFISAIKNAKILFWSFYDKTGSLPEKLLDVINPEMIFVNCAKEAIKSVKKMFLFSEVYFLKKSFFSLKLIYNAREKSLEKILKKLS